MLVAVLVLGPGVLASSFHAWLSKRRPDSVSFIFSALAYSALINIFLVIAMYLRGHGTLPLEYMYTNINTTAKTGLLALFTSLAMPCTIFVLSKTRFANQIKDKKQNGDIADDGQFE